MRYLRATTVGIAVGVLLNVAWLAISLAWLAWFSYKASHDTGIGVVAGGVTDVTVPILFVLGFVLAFAWSLRKRGTAQLG